MTLIWKEIRCVLVILYCVRAKPVLYKYSPEDSFSYLHAGPFVVYTEHPPAHTQTHTHAQTVFFFPSRFPLICKTHQTSSADIVTEISSEHISAVGDPIKQVFFPPPCTGEACRCGGRKNKLKTAGLDQILLISCVQVAPNITFS